MMQVYESLKSAVEKWTPEMRIKHKELMKKHCENYCTYEEAFCNAYVDYVRLVNDHLIKKEV